MSSGVGFYRSKELGNVEIATLVQDIPLPKYDKVLTGEMIKSMVKTGSGTFTPITTAYSSVTADFYIAIEIPNLSQDDKIDKNQAAPNIQQGGNKLNTTTYKTGNTVKLEIPKYLVMMFDNKIPKGTKFLVASLANQADAGNIRIISLYNKAPSQIYNESTENRVMGGGR